MRMMKMLQDALRAIVFTIFSCSVLLAAPAGYAQLTDLFGEQPDPAALGAPMYPGAAFIRVTASVDPFYESVIYVSPDPVSDVLDFYNAKLSDVRRIQFTEENEWVWTFLLKDWIPMPKQPSREDLAILDNSPNVMVRAYQPELYMPMIELMSSRPGNDDRIEALNNAKSIIRFSYRKRQNDIGFTKLQGIWENVDRDLPEYRGCTISFNPDSSYVITLSDDNIAALAAKMARSRKYAGKSVEELISLVAKNNPERGIFAVLRNTIDLETDTPVFGDPVKSGLIEIRSVMFSAQFINMPKLTFIRKRGE